MIRAETTLDDIFRKGHLLFLDTSAGKGLKHEGVHSWYADGIYDAQRFEQVDYASLMNGLEELQILRQIALEDITLVTPEVLAEINRLSEIMKEHFEYMHKKRQSRTRKASHYEPGELQRERQIYDAFNTCVLDLFSIQKRLERKVFQGQHEEQTYLRFLNDRKAKNVVYGICGDISSEDLTKRVAKILERFKLSGKVAAGYDPLFNVDASKTHYGARETHY